MSMRRAYAARICAGLIGMLAVPQVLAAGDPMQGRYGNTQRIEQPDGRLMRAMFNADKSVTLMRSDGSVMQGTWGVEGDQLCISVSMMLAPMKRCMPFAPDKKPGDTWKQKGPDGQEVTVTIAPGRN
jgi:hypothetical protein